MNFLFTMLREEVRLGLWGRGGAWLLGAGSSAWVSLAHPTPLISCFMAPVAL